LHLEPGEYRFGLTPGPSLFASLIKRGDFGPRLTTKLPEPAEEGWVHFKSSKPPAPAILTPDPGILPSILSATKRQWSEVEGYSKLNNNDKSISFRPSISD
jgi:hypothetical protein